MYVHMYVCTLTYVYMNVYELCFYVCMSIVFIYNYANYSN